GGTGSRRARWGAGRRAGPRPPRSAGRPRAPRGGSPARTPRRPPHAPWVRAAARAPGARDSGAPRGARASTAAAAGARSRTTPRRGRGSGRGDRPASLVDLGRILAEPQQEHVPVPLRGHEPAEIEGLLEAARDVEVAGAVDANGVGRVVPGAAVALAPPVRALFVKGRDEHLRAPLAHERTAAEVDGIAEEAGDVQAAHAVERDRAPAVVHGAAKGLAPDVVAAPIELGQEDVEASGV